MTALAARRGAPRAARVPGKAELERRLRNLLRDSCTYLLHPTADRDWSIRLFDGLHATLETLEYPEMRR